MNNVIAECFSSRSRRLWAAIAVATLVVLSGCSTDVSTPVELTAFNEAGPIRLPMDYRQMMDTRLAARPYTLGSGDVLELRMPAILRNVPNRGGDETTPCRCRVDSQGLVVLPILGEVQVGGKTVGEVEDLVANLYYPRYVKQKPGIVASVAEYRVTPISVVGAVEKPGSQELRSNERTLFAALLKAGGVSKDGATAVHIQRTQDGQTTTQTVPVVGMNIPASDVELCEGDTVVVEARDPEVITIVGLVNKPGLLPCSPRDHFSVMDALAFAGGVNLVADPEYVKVYRQNDAGQVVSAVVKLSDNRSLGGGQLYLKPGDVVSVEQTDSTRTRMVLASLVRVGLGVNAGATVSPY